MPLVAASKKLIKFDTKTFLSTINGGRKIADFPKKKTIFAQGDSSDAVFYIKEGKVRLTVVSEIGKEATIGVLNEGDFFGEGCLTGQPLRLCSATAMTDCSVMKIDKKSMTEVLHRGSLVPPPLTARAGSGSPCWRWPRQSCRPPTGCLLRPVRLPGKFAMDERPRSRAIPSRGPSHHPGVGKDRPRSSTPAVRDGARYVAFPCR